MIHSLKVPGSAEDQPCAGLRRCVLYYLFMARIAKTTTLPSGITGGYPEAAAASTSQGSNKDLKFTAVTKDATSNDISVTYVKPGTASQSLSVSVTSKAITVNLATDSGSAASSTANQILAAVNASTPAKALVTASLATGSTGAGIPGAMTALFLSGGRTQTQGTGSNGWAYLSARPRPNARY